MKLKLSLATVRKGYNRLIDQVSDQQKKIYKANSKDQKLNQQIKSLNNRSKNEMLN